jgi:hypothetical protein
MVSWLTCIMGSLGNSIRNRAEICTVETALPSLAAIAVNDSPACRNLYAKLGTHHRAETVTRARDLACSHPPSAALAERILAPLPGHGSGLTPAAW